MIKINGIIEHIIFQNETNGYLVAKLKTEEDAIIIVGNYLGIKTSIEYELMGDFIYNNKYGEQFKFQEIKEIKPKSKEGIIKYLSSGIIPFIGEKTAENIYKEFKDESLNIIENNSEKLLKVEGIGQGKLEKIKNSLEEGKEFRKIMLFLSEYSISINLAFKIYKEFKENTINEIKENPYILSERISGVGFKKSDEIAIKMGYDLNSSYRKRAALKYVLYLSTLNGHSFLPKDILFKETSNLLDMDEINFEDELYKLSIDDKFFIEKSENDINCYYSPYLKAENYVAGKILELTNYEFNEIIDIDKIINEVNKNQHINLAEKQINAVKESLESGCLIITGGPGTGKTTTLKAIIEAFEFINKKVLLAAPTGRAAKRMKEATGRDASTIHRLLDICVRDEDLTYSYEEIEEIDCDILIIDEISMMDLLLMNTLLKSIKLGTRIILVGDVDQLPSVGAGNILSDLIESNKINVIKLEEVFRQSEKSNIIKNAHLINKGITPQISNKGDFFFISCENENEILETVVNLVDKRLPNYYGYNKLDIQVLNPMKKGVLGVQNLNKHLQERINPKGESIVYGDTLFRVGDKVMQIKNNYELEYEINSDDYIEKNKGVFNGDIGIITEIYKQKREIEITYDEIKKVRYPYEGLDEISLSYAMTIHKSQGSEFPIIVMPMYKIPYILATRNLLYTGITRGKKIVVLVGNFKYFDLMVKNNKISNRYSNLAKKLRNLQK